MGSQVPEAPVRLVDVRVWVPGGRVLLDGIDLVLPVGGHLAVLGPNGAGKTTLLQLCSGRRHPSAGQVHLLGRLVGRVDLRELRVRIGLVDAAERVAPGLDLTGYLLTGVGGGVAPRPSLITEADRRRAGRLLVEMALDPQTALATASAGELARARIARALIAGPELLVLDEPTAGLDLAGRELALGAIARLAADRPALATITVAHHVEDLPASTTDVVLLRAGRLLHAGPVAETLTAEKLSACFGLPLTVKREAGRWYARAGSG